MGDARAERESPERFARRVPSRHHPIRPWSRRHGADPSDPEGDDPRPAGVLHPVLRRRHREQQHGRDCRVNPPAKCVPDRLR